MALTPYGIELSQLASNVNLVRVRVRNPLSKTSRRMRRQMREDLAWHRAERDPVENRESTPPDDERLRWHGVYVAEAYGPARISGLVEAVKRLGWNEEQQSGPGDSKLGDWIERSRGRSTGAAYWSFTLTRRGPPHFGPRIYQASLPPHVDYARCHVFTLTPALTVIVLLCVFDDALAGAVEASLRRPFQTECERFDRGWRVETASNRKMDAVAADRERSRECAGQFLRDNLPGTFTLLDRELPACEVITTTRLRPFERPEGVGPEVSHHYSWILGLGHETEAWRSDELPGFGLQLPNGLSRSPALVLAGRHDDVSAGIESFYGGNDSERLGGYLHHRLDGLMALWASYQLLNGYQALLGSTRDLERLPVRRPSRARRRLTKVRDELLVGSSDARTLAEELQASVDQGERGPWKRLIETDFQAVEPRYWRAPTLIKTLLESVADDAESLQRTERRGRDDLVVDSSVVGAAANLRVQRNLSWLTVVIGLASIALLVSQIVSSA